MTDKAIIQGSLVDVRNVNQHKCVRMLIDVPAEHAPMVMAAFGWPTMANPVPVAIAHLKPAAKLDQTEQAEADYRETMPMKTERKGGRLAQKAAMTCNEAAFAEFVRNRKFSGTTAEYVHRYCQVASRAHLDHDEAAARRFHDLELEYNAWIKVEAA